MFLIVVLKIYLQCLLTSLGFCILRSLSIPVAETRVVQYDKYSLFQTTIILQAVADPKGESGNQLGNFSGLTSLSEKANKSYNYSKSVRKNKRSSSCKQE